MGDHIIDNEFQSDKYPTCPRGKVPLSVRDSTAQDLLWEYAQRRRAVDEEFAEDLETALRNAGYVPTTDKRGITYRCKHTVEAMQWRDTEELREAFAAWFERQDAIFSTRGSIVVLPEEGQYPEGWWILFSAGEFIAMEDEEFRAEYEATP